MYAGSLGKKFRLKNSDFSSKPHLNTEDDEIKRIENELNNIDHNYKIGISWKSFRKKKSIGLIKSMELNDFQSLINLPKFTFINLQYGDIKKEILEFNKNNNKIHTIESVDMNRVLETGGKIRMVLTDAITIGVDVPEELKEVEKILINDLVIKKYLSL